MLHREVETIIHPGHSCKSKIPYIDGEVTDIYLLLPTWINNMKFKSQISQVWMPNLVPLCLFLLLYPWIGEGNGNPLQYSRLGNLMDRGSLAAYSPVQFSRSVVSDSLWPHELQHARHPCPSPTPGALTRWTFVDKVVSAFEYAVSVQFSSVTQSCPTLCDPMNHSTPGLPVHHQLPEFTQTHIHRVSDAIQPSHPLLTPFPPAPNPSQHQSLFQWVNSSHEVEMCYWWNNLIFLDHSFDI